MTEENDGPSRRTTDHAHTLRDGRKRINGTVGSGPQPPLWQEVCDDVFRHDGPAEQAGQAELLSLLCGPVFSGPQSIAALSPAQALA